MESNITKYTKPAIVIALVVNTIVLIFLDSFSDTFNVEESWISLVEVVLITVIAAYFGSKTLEKIKKQ